MIKSAKTKLGNTVELVGNPKGKVLIIGVFHGDEPQGKFLIDEYTDKSHGLFIPCLNPDGMQNGTRTNSNGVDLNRNFPTKNWGKNEGENATCDDKSTDYYGGTSPASEFETKFLIEVIDEYNPKLILTLHSPYKVVNFDGPARDIAHGISEIINYPVEESIGYPTPGSFGTWAGIERQIPVITLELDEQCAVEDLLMPVHRVFDYVINSFSQ